MRVFMTGATGFIGLNIVNALIRNAHEVVCHVRPGARRQYLDRLPVSVLTGSWDDAGQLAAAMQGCECVIHTAGNTSCSWRDIEALTAANVDSTRAVLDAALQAGVRRIVYTSSTATIGSTELADLPADESHPLSGWRAGSPYAQTKRAAETMLAMARGIESITLNPAEVVGPWDHTLQWGRIVLALAAGKLPFIPPGAGTFAAARDVADAHVAALTLGTPGERYILGGHQMSFAAFIAEAALICGRAAVPVNTRPYRLQCIQARIQELLQPVLRRPPAVDSYRMRVFGGIHLFDDGKARRHLGYSQQPIRDAISECYRWYQEHGFLPGSQAIPSVTESITKEWQSA